MFLNTAVFNYTSNTCTKALIYSCKEWRDDTVWSICDLKTEGIDGQDNKYSSYSYNVKGEITVVPTDKICGQSLSSKIPVDMNSIFMKLYVTWPTWPKGHILRKSEFSKWFL